jgi:hypothetical protein
MISESARDFKSNIWLKEWDKEFEFEGENYAGKLEG